ncbi:MAG: class I SAM-dependent methyltransferase [Chloroflexi bacterium]|nr:MAG: class I SAM-dependent methyltransferase [Chloroflexota bacterium]
MPDLNNPNYLLTQQYKTAANLTSRVNIHARFSTNPYGWYRWVFDQYQCPPHCQALELGCGMGDTWKANLARIPADCQVILSDFSSGMVEQAQRNLESSGPFAFEVIDAQSIPYETGRFDVVIANHMLYHVPDRPRALAEIHRVLKPGGRFYATTIGERHMHEMLELPHRFDPGNVVDHLGVTGEFSLESGEPQLRTFFASVRLCRYPDSLHITESAPLVDYIFSTFEFNKPAEQRAAFETFVAEEMQRRGGAFDVTKDSGMFISS